MGKILIIVNLFAYQRWSYCQIIAHTEFIAWLVLPCFDYVSQGKPCAWFQLQSKKERSNKNWDLYQYYSTVHCSMPDDVVIQLTE
jgi:hypothetical protein